MTLDDLEAERDLLAIKTQKHLTSVGAHPETPVYGLSEDPEMAIFKGVLEERIPCKTTDSI